MKKYMVIYHMPDSLLAETANTTPEEAAKGMEQWHTWAKECGEHLLELGSPLTTGLKLNNSGKHETSNREVCGYSVLQANSIEEATSLLEKHPHIQWNEACEIEVHEMMPLPG